jgi:hypothetical protein
MHSEEELTKILMMMMMNMMMSPMEMMRQKILMHHLNITLSISKMLLASRYLAKHQLQLKKLVCLANHQLKVIHHLRQKRTKPKSPNQCSELRSSTASKAWHISCLMKDTT